MRPTEETEVKNDFELELRDEVFIEEKTKIEQCLLKPQAHSQPVVSIA